MKSYPPVFAFILTLIACLSLHDYACAQTTRYSSVEKESKVIEEIQTKLMEEYARINSDENNNSFLVHQIILKLKSINSKNALPLAIENLGNPSRSLGYSASSANTPDHYQQILFENPNKTIELILNHIKKTENNRSLYVNDAGDTLAFMMRRDQKKISLYCDILRIDYDRAIVDAIEKAANRPIVVPGR